MLTAPIGRRCREGGETWRRRKMFYPLLAPAYNMWQLPAALLFLFPAFFTPFYYPGTSAMLASGSRVFYILAPIGGNKKKIYLENLLSGTSNFSSCIPIFTEKFSILFGPKYLTNSKDIIGVFISSILLFVKGTSISTFL